MRNHPNDNIRFVSEISSCESISSVVVMSNTEKEGFFTLYSLVTQEKFRGTGITKTLVDNCISWVQENGGEIIQTSTDTENLRAQKFLENYGFNRIPSSDDKQFYYELHCI